MSIISENAITVLERRYLHRDENNEVDETVDELFHRVANFIASAEKKHGKSEDEIAELAKKYYTVMTDLDFLPNSPTLMNAGQTLGQLSACFVLPIEDSMEKIFETIKNTALIHKSGGGTGFSFSRLRSRGATVQSTGGVASGPLSFMKVFNIATEAVKQGGKRRGANMGILRVDHPDIIEFIRAKEDKTELTNFNLSVWLTDDFMAALETESNFDLIEPSTNKVVDSINAKEVFDLIVEKAWLNGEPGIIFMDQVNKKNPVPHLGNVESTNPCGEQPLLPFESCNLGSINLINFYEDGLKGINFQRLGEIVELCVNFLDNVIDMNMYPIAEIDKMTKSTRKVGLGIMGFADVLCRMGIPYNSQEAVVAAEQIMSFIDEKSKAVSSILAKSKGTFPAYNGSTWEQDGKILRNATTTTIAPTGTISMIAGCSSGIEPLFGIAYYKLCMDGDKLMEVHPYFEQVAKERGFYSEEIMQQVIAQGSIANIAEIPDDVKKVFVTTRDIEPEWHIKIQSAFQKYTDNAVSKTINFHTSASKEDIAAAYLLSYKSGCKGITVYRDGSRDEQVLNIGTQEKKDEKIAKHGNIAPRHRPGVTQGMTEKAIAGCGNLYITVNYDEQGICEVFTNLGKGGGCPSQTEATSRLVSLAMRSGINPESVIEQLKGIRCPSTLARKAKGADVRALSCPDAIAKTLERVLKTAHNGNGDKHGLDLDNIVAEIEEMQLDTQGNAAKCPECSSILEHEGGCVLCHTCGYSKCN